MGNDIREMSKRMSIAGIGGGKNKDAAFNYGIAQKSNSIVVSSRDCYSKNRASYDKIGQKYI